MSLRRVCAWTLLLLAAGAGRLFGQSTTITDFTPTLGSPGDTVQLNGSGFTLSFFVVFWNGQPVTDGAVISDTLLKVVVPSGITTGPIGIVQNGTTNYTAADFTAIGFGPYIADVTPAFGSVNDLITINGAHFTNATAVKFNNTPSTSVIVNGAATQISARVPAGATSGPITVVTPQGTNNSPGPFTVVGAGPYITAFTPTAGSAGATVFVYGVHFTGATNATFNGVPGINFFVQSDTQLRVDAPSGVTTGPMAVNSPSGRSQTSSNFFVAPVIRTVSPGLGRAGTNVVLTGSNFLGTVSVSFAGTNAAFTVVNNTNIQTTVPVGARTGLIRVTTPAFSAFSAANFVVQPTVTGFAPNIGIPGTSVTISGANFNVVGTPTVRFNGVAAAPPTGISFGQLTAVVPAGTTTGPISVTTTDGSYTNANNFFLPPSITNFTPTNSLPGTLVVITGQNFIGASAVSFAGQPATSFAVSNNTIIGATVPVGVLSGPVTVLAPAGLATSVRNFYGAPIITDFAPRHGLPGTNVTLIGTNLLGATTVRFNGVSATFGVVNNNQISATVPNGAQTGPITVVAPAGTNTSTLNFSLDYTSDLSVSITNSPNPVTVGSNLLYNITIWNSGLFDAPNATLTNTLPASVHLLAASISAPWTLVTNGNPITGSASSFPNGGSATLLLTVAPQSPGNILDTIKVSSDNSDPAPGDNFATINTTVDPLALLSIQQQTNTIKVSWPSALTNYSLQYRNDVTNGGFWSNSTAVPVISGAQKSVTETNNGSAKYYRLKK
jgi:hypothetical protein